VTKDSPALGKVDDAGNVQQRPVKILVAYGTKRGGTQGLAQILGHSLATRGAEVAVEPAVSVSDVRGFDAVIVGGSLYIGRWHRDATRLVKRCADDLAGLPVWLFSSGPLGEDAEEHPDVPPVDKVAGLMERIGARGHVTFGGALEPDATGFIASKMAKTMAGDWRDPDAIDEWADEIMASLTGAVA
jgi:menaquinone-dependent protoporphyrinogen oxidase